MADFAVTRELIMAAVARLPAEHRAVLRRSYYEARTAAQIADDLHIDQADVRSRLHYGLRAMLLTLQESEVTVGDSDPEAPASRSAAARPDSCSTN